MSFMEWVLNVAERHPDLDRAILSPDGEWLDVLLPDGRTFRFRPAQLLDSTLPEDERTNRLNKLLTIGTRNAQLPEADPATRNSETPASPPTPSTHTTSQPTLDKEGNPLILPIVRAADYFLRSHNPHDDDSIAYLPLTDFIGVGLANDYSNSIQPLFYSQLQERGIYNRALDSHIHEIFGHAIETLRTLNVKQGKRGVEIGMTRIAGARVFTFTAPEEYQSSWFADLDIIQQVAAAIVAESPDNLPLFVPISRTYLQIVFADDPHLADFFHMLYRHMNPKDFLYPLPHTVASDGWREWIPMSDHRAAPILEILRTDVRARIYKEQSAFLNAQASKTGVVKDYVVRDIKNSGRKISVATWLDTDEHGSIPLTDFIVFLKGDAGDTSRGSNTMVRTSVVRDMWDGHISEVDNVWPPRLTLTGFPDDETLTRMKDNNLSGI